jgi:hypothetical protein
VFERIDPNIMTVWYCERINHLSLKYAQWFYWDHSGYSIWDFPKSDEWVYIGEFE